MLTACSPLPRVILSSHARPTSRSDAGVRRISGRDSPGWDWITSTSICLVLGTRERLGACSTPLQVIQVPSKGFFCSPQASCPQRCPGS